MGQENSQAYVLAEDSSGMESPMFYGYGDWQAGCTCSNWRAPPSGSSLGGFSITFLLLWGWERDLIYTKHTLSTSQLNTVPGVQEPATVQTGLAYLFNGPENISLIN